MQIIDKNAFVALLTEAGINDEQKQRLHALFEKRFPEAHARFLAALGLEAAQVEQIRSRARNA